MFQTSYIDYYKNIYGIQIYDQNQPMLISKPKKSKNRFVDNQVCG